MFSSYNTLFLAFLLGFVPVVESHVLPALEPVALLNRGVDASTTGSLSSSSSANPTNSSSSSQSSSLSSTSSLKTTSSTQTSPSSSTSSLTTTSSIGMSSLSTTSSSTTSTLTMISSIPTSSLSVTSSSQMDSQPGTQTSSSSTISNSGYTSQPSTQISSFSNTPNLTTTSQHSTITAAANISSKAKGTKYCVLGDDDCTDKGVVTTIAGPKIPGLGAGLKDQCMLWNSSCSGNLSHALNTFFDDTGSYLLFENTCFVDPEPNCTLYQSPDELAEFAEIKSWMRSPSCLSSSLLWNSIHHDAPATSGPIAGDSGVSCCNTCYLSGASVDIYYWPVPDADTSCLGTVGEKVNAMDEGATTTHDIDDDATTYWGCTAATPKDGSSIITTAVITSVGTLTYKAPIVNPCSAPACVGEKDSPPKAKGKASVTSAAQQPQDSLQARAHSLVVNASITQNANAALASTVVLDGYTFTSPYVYAKFYGLGAGDWCGATTVPATMLSFAPGELSTIAGPLYSGISDGQSRPNLATKAFNPADLPCPPQSVMEENWYKPTPGEPYRPLIAVPDKVRAIDPWFSACTDLWFDAVDPPRALRPAEGMDPSDPVITGPVIKAPANGMVPVQTVAPAAAPAPAIQQPEAANTALADSTPSPAPAQAPSDPPQKAPPQQDPPQQDPPKQNPPQQAPPQQDPPQQDPPKQDPPQQETNPPAQNDNGNTQKPANDPDTPTAPQQNQNGGGNAGNTGNRNPASNPQDPGQKDQNWPISDSNNVAPAQMSQLESALATNSPAQPAPGQPQEGGRVPPAPAAQPAPGQQQEGGNSAPPPAAVPGQEQQGGNPPSSPAGNQGGNLQVPNLAPTTMQVGGHAVVVNPSGVAIDGTPANPGDTPVPVAGGVAMNQGDSVVIASHIAHVTAPPNPPATTIAGHTVQSLPNGGVLIDNNLVTPGAAPITVSGTAVSIDSSNHIYIAGTSYPLPTAVPTAPTTLANGAIAQPLPNGAVSIDGTTITPNAPAVTIAGTTLSLDTAHNLIVDGTAAALPTITASPWSTGQITTINGQPITLLPNNAIAIAGTTLAPNSPAITIAGTAISLGASALVVGSSTIPFAAATTTPPAPFTTTIDNHPLTAAPSALTLAGTTLLPGGLALTLDGTIVSLNTAGELVVGSRTVPLGLATTSEAVGVGGWVASGFGAGAGPGAGPTTVPGATPGAAGTGTGVEGFTGGAGKVRGERGWRLWVVMGLVGVEVGVWVV